MAVVPIHTGDVIQLDWANVEFQKNEVHFKSLTDDPSGVSFHSPGPGRSLGKISFKRDNIEYVLIQGKVREDGVPGGEIYVGVLDARLGTGDAAMIEIMTLTCDSVHFHVPVLGAGDMPMPTPPPSPSGSVPAHSASHDGAEFWAVDDTHVCVRQGDKNFVVYEKTPQGLVARWSKLTGCL